MGMKYLGYTLLFIGIIGIVPGVFTGEFGAVIILLLIFILPAVFLIPELKERIFGIMIKNGSHNKNEVTGEQKKETDKKVCPLCKTEINKKAIKCPSCHGDLRGFASKHPILSLLLFLFILGTVSQAMLGSVKVTENQISKNDVSQQVKNPVGNTPIIEKPENWQFYEDKDEMTDKTVRHMITDSTNSVSLDFPYHGGRKANIDVRNKGGEKDVMISVPKTQIHSEYSDEHVMVRFDDKPAVKYYYVEPIDNSSDLIFLKNTTGFIENLKNSKKVKIQIGFFQNGTHTFEFNTEGFDYQELIK